MKIIITLLVSLLFCVQLRAQTTNENVSKNEFQAELRKISDGMNLTRKSLTESKKLVLREKQVTDSLARLVSLNQASLVSGKAEVVRIQKSVADLQSAQESQRTASRLKLVIALLTLLCLTGVSYVFILLNKRRSDMNQHEMNAAFMGLRSGLQTSVESLRSSVNKLATELSSNSQVFEERLHAFEHRINEAESMAGKITDDLKTELRNFRDDSELFRKSMDDRRNEVLQLMEKRHEEVSSRLSKETGNLKELVQNLARDFSSLKGN